MQDFMAVHLKSHRRVLISQALSAAFFAVLLTLHGPLITRIVRFPDIDPRTIINVTIQYITREPDISGETSSGLTTPPESRRKGELQPVVPEEPEAEIAELSDVLQQQERSRRIQEVAQQAISNGVERYIEQEAIRESRWRKSRSIVDIAPQAIVDEPEGPLLTEFAFKPEIHVFGLGVTLGSCFFGIPIVGVPIEKRTAGPNVIVCFGKND